MKGQQIMKQQPKIAFLGGDGRQQTAAVKLSGGEWNIFVWGQPNTLNNNRIFYCDNIYETIADAFAIVLPLPASTDGVLLNCRADLPEKSVSLMMIADMISQDAIVIGGKLPKNFTDYALSKGIKCIDYFESEAFQIKNAYTTAEAAVSIAMANLDKNIYRSKIAITGYGRIAKQLSRLLVSMGAEVTVCARKESDLVWAELSGAKTLLLNEKDPRSLRHLTDGYDVIYNTVPRWLFDEDFLREVDKNTLMIELASAPGGIDVSAAKRLGSKVLWAASLPGKYAPESAGQIISDCVRSILDAERGSV